MKYEQPYGVSDPNAAYINGNPSTGTMGSIPPAASIENPQREIVNFIADSGLTPTDADLHQLGRGIQGGHVAFSPDTGSVNNVVLTLTPAPTAYTDGMMVRFKAANTPQGPSVININGLGNKRMRGRNNLDIRAADWLAGDMVAAVYDGPANAFQVFGTDAQPRLQAPRTYFVATNGSDSNDGLTAATPFLTIQHAINVCSIFNQNGFDITIFIANGTYVTATSIVCPVINGSGNIYITGNAASPQAVTITCNSGSTFQIYGPWYHFNGLRLQSLAAAVADPGKGLTFDAGQGYAQNIAFGICNDGCINAGGSASVLLSGTFWLELNTPCFVQGIFGGFCETNEVTWPTINLNSGLTFSRAFVVASYTAIVSLRFAAINLGGATFGPRYLASTNGVVSSGGSGPNYFPGDQPGVTASGGQYS
jgi:hypothetical protein